MIMARSMFFRNQTGQQNEEQPVILDVDPNTTGHSRTAAITITNTDGETIKFIATQAR